VTDLEQKVRRASIVLLAALIFGLAGAFGFGVGVGIWTAS
jgi:hypothetical protein